MKNKFYVAIYVILVIATAFLFCMSVNAEENSTEFFGGDGTENNPYIIGNKEHLNNVRKYPDAYFVLVTDITFSEYDFEEEGSFYNQGNGWEPIPVFSGTFDGGGKTIYGLTATPEDPTNGMVGVFGNNSGTILSLNVEGINYLVNSNYNKISSSVVYVGGVAAHNSGIIENCNITGYISTSSLTSSKVYPDGYIGGIVGFNKGNVQNCSSKVDFSTSILVNSSEYGSLKYTGGIAGQNNGTISACYNIGKVERGHFSGGIAGNNENTIENCFNIGNVRSVGKDDVISYSGGICGTNSGTIRTSYNIGKVNTDSASACVALSTGTVEDCYSYTSSFDNGDFMDGLSKEQMQTEEAFRGFDFNDIWTFDEKSEYPFPVLQSAASISLPESGTDLFGGGSGFVWDPYIVSTTIHMSNIENFPDAYYILTNNLSISGTDWNPLVFSGGFDGNDNSISINFTGTLSSNTAYGDIYYGIFKSNQGVVCNLNVSANLQITIAEKDKNIYVGGLAAVNSGLIRNVKISGSIQVYDNSSGYIYVYVGGFSGSNSGTIIDCDNSSTITTSCRCSRVGGISGSSSLASIIGCSNMGNITASGDRHGESVFSYAGGIAGEIFRAEINNCSNNGKISATSNTYSKIGYGYTAVNLKAAAGGGVGYWRTLETVSNGRISNCTNSGSISATATVQGVPVRIRTAFSGGICGNAGYDVIFSGLLGPSLSATGLCYIERCKNSGSVSASTSNTYNTSGTNINYYAGAISGVCSGTTTNCYNTGTTYSGLKGAINSYDAGKSASYNKLEYPVIDSERFCYYLEGTPSIKYTQVSTDEEMRIQETYIGFDFEKDWIMLPGSYPYPQLRSNLATPVKSIYIVQQPSAPLECIDGYFPSYNGLKLGILFEDGTSVVTEPWGECFSMLDTSSKGIHSVALTVLDCRTDDTIDIIVRDKQLVSIDVKTLPTKTRYFKDVQEIDPRGAVLQLNYDDTSYDTIEILSEMVTGFVPGKIGCQPVTITYSGKSCSLEVTVYDIVGISIEILPQKTAYVQGQPISGIGGSFSTIFSDGEKEVHSLELATLDYPKNSIGNVQATATYLGYTANFAITVNERIVKSVKVENDPYKTIYRIGDDLDLTGGVIRVNFVSEDNYYELIPMEASMISGFNSSAVGYPNVTVSYGNKSDSFVVRVKAASTISGSIKSFGNDTEVTVELLKGNLIVNTVSVDNTYSLSNIDPDTYTFRISKPQHCTREYEVVVTDSDVTLNLEIWLYGDVNGDGNVNHIDVLQINRNISNQTSVFDAGDADLKAYRFKVANVTAVTSSDEILNHVDVLQINRKIANLSSIFNSIS